MKTAIWILLASMAPVVGCSNDGSLREPPVCDEVFSSVDDFGIGAWAGCESLFEYAPEDVLDSVLGTWQGSYPGGSSFDEFDFTLVVSVTDEILGSDKALRFYLPSASEECSDPVWQTCTASGLDFHIQVEFVTSGTEQLPGTIGIDPNDRYMLTVRGTALQEGSGFPESLDGIPLVFFKPDDVEAEDEFGGIFIAFLPSGNVFFSFWNGDDQYEWVEVTVTFV